MKFRTWVSDGTCCYFYLGLSTDERGTSTRYVGWMFSDGMVSRMSNIRLYRENTEEIDFVPARNYCRDMIEEIFIRRWGLKDE